MMAPPKERILAFFHSGRASAVVHYAVIAAGISAAVIVATHRGGTQARQQLEAVSAAFQKYTPLQRLIP